VLSGSDDTNIRIWKSNASQPTKTVRSSPPLFPHYHYLIIFLSHSVTPPWKTEVRIFTKVKRPIWTPTTDQKNRKVSKATTLTSSSVNSSPFLTTGIDTYPRQSIMRRNWKLWWRNPRTGKNRTDRPILHQPWRRDPRRGRNTLLQPSHKEDITSASYALTIKYHL